MTPTFSIIIPVYNVAPYLRECLDSVLAQTYTDWEAICVDDGSTDGSGTILDEYAAKDQRFKVIHQTNAGVSAARNVALDVVCGEWFLFLDGDDCFRDDALKTFVKIGVYNDVDGILVSPYIPQRWFGGPQPDRIVRNEVLVNNATNVDLVLGPYGANGFPFNRLYRSSKFSSVRFREDMRMGEDVCFWFDALRMNKCWRIIAAEIYLYRSRADSACGVKNPHLAANALESVLHVFRSIDSGTIRCKDAKYKYFTRYSWFATEYISIVVDNALKLSCSEWRVLRSKVKCITAVTGWDVFNWKVALKYRLACYSVTRILVPVVSFGIRALGFLKRRIFNRI